MATPGNTPTTRLRRRTLGLALSLFAAASPCARALAHDGRDDCGASRQEARCAYQQAHPRSRVLASMDCRMLAGYTEHLRWQYNEHYLSGFLRPLPPQTVSTEPTTSSLLAPQPTPTPRPTPLPLPPPSEVAHPPTTPPTTETPRPTQPKPPTTPQPEPPPSQPR